MSGQKVSPTRRQMITGGVMLASPILGRGVALAADTAFKESPMLSALASQGKLPGVQQRLPEHPYVEAPHESVGRYGGTLRTAILGAGDQYNLTRTIANETLIRWTPDWTKLVPSIAEDIHASADGREFTFKLRRGMRWSDGEPFGADDVMFWYEDVFLRPELTPAKNPVFVVEGEPVKVDKVDDLTVRFRFASPYGQFLQQMAFGAGQTPVIYPKHYLKQFHVRYNAAGLDALISQDAKARDWATLFNSKVSLPFLPAYWQNLDLPTLGGWVLKSPYGGPDRVTAERNPYYWKVDTAGNQLPYIDRITYDRIDDVQLMVLKATNGDYDYMYRHVVTPTYQSVLDEGRAKGGYHFFELRESISNDAVLMLNLNVTDPVKRAVFQNKDFRVALSMAIDRQEIIDLVLVGRGDPVQVSMASDNPLYNERLAKQYTQFDPAGARLLLDRIGLDKKDAQGFRMGPDGKRFTIVFMVADVFGNGYPDIMEQVQRYAKDVGLDIQLRVTDRARLTTMLNANEQEAYIWNATGSLSDVYTDVRAYMPFQKADLFFAMRWAEWYADPKQGEEPPAPVKAQMKLYDQVKAATDEAERTRAMAAVLEMSADIFYTIGIYRPKPKVGIASNRLRNVPDPMYLGGAFWHPAPNLAQFYFSA